MSSPKNVFSIKDLENLSGIKAHTIRIWEKRYHILSPMRVGNNARIYDIKALQKLLNINTLNRFGYKISVIAQLPEEKIPEMVNDILSKGTLYSHAVSNFKVAMMNFDVPLFFNTYETLLANKSFRDIFYDCFLPLLQEIGNLWQTGTITPAHEHFISSLVKQKISGQIEKLQANTPTHTNRTFVLYLPDNEIHEIGLLFINYELLLQGYKTVYIGESVPLESLAETMNYFDRISFVTYFTTNPEPAYVTPYIKTLIESLLNNTKNNLCVLGRNAEHINPDLIGKNLRVYNNIKQFVEEVEYLL
jgi:MerR family transcriptional regulator, light-induced transcriptional regulator